jgi:hypothetical protein
MVVAAGRQSRLASVFCYNEDFFGPVDLPNAMERDVSKCGGDFVAGWHGEEQLVVFSPVQCQPESSSVRVFQGGRQGQKVLRDPGSYAARLAKMTEVG